MSERHIIDRPITTIREALDYITPAPSNNGSIIFQAVKLRQAAEIIRKEFCLTLEVEVPAAWKTAMVPGVPSDW